MDFKDMIKEDIKKMQDKEKLPKLQNKVIGDYKKFIDLNNELLSKFTVSNSFKDEVYKFFTDNGCVKSETNHEGKDFKSPYTTYFKYSDNDTQGKTMYISVTFGDLNVYGKSISIIRHSSNLQYGLIYTAESSYDNLLSAKVNIMLNDDALFYDNYEKKILECTSIKDLSNLENQLKENIEDFEAKLSKDCTCVGLYQLRDGQKFKTFAEAFSNLK